MAGKAAGTLYMRREQMEAWFAGAAAGTKCVYASGPGLDHREPVVAMAAEWAASGEAELFKVRDPGNGQLLHCVRRKRPVALDLDEAERGGRRRRVSVSEAFRETPEGRIYMMLVRSANLKRPCPSNAELAQFAGLKNADQARYLLHEKLVKPGLIEVRHDGAGNAQRRVKIAETGRWTAPLQETVR